ncbi:DNA-directed RNA polymerases I and III subunit RPAC2 [Geodia barretti]|uniref:DNA-directed RNA polymerases I and III subunit RPAC2 n=1 Tax=Geodia barretti TaxID=519541 RepID=A0AA35RRB0_GEOBA|nr:DNA-directed RNA polymerases I and III subunit RPAC2 [Geodia barretti]
MLQLAQQARGHIACYFCCSGRCYILQPLQASVHCYLPNMTASDPSIERRLEMLSMDDVDDVTCVTFVLRGEDHTLGNALRYIIMKNPEVEFCGYAVPHPSENKINLRIQTRGQPAAEVLRKGLEDLHSLCAHVLKTFKREVRAFKEHHHPSSSLSD